MQGVSGDAMKAITIRQPWIHAILYFGKRVENRDWDPNGGNVAAARRLVGQTIALHAGRGCTRDEYMDAADFMRGVYAEQPWEGSTYTPGLKDPALTRGAVVGTATLADVTLTMASGHRRNLIYIPNDPCRLCGESVGMGEDWCPKADLWAIPGCLGLLLADVRALPTPVPWSGALGFFDVPNDVVRP